MAYELSGEKWLYHTLLGPGVTVWYFYAELMAATNAMAPAQKSRSIELLGQKDKRTCTTSDRGGFGTRVYGDATTACFSIVL